jgi:hypothetical protein
MITMPPCTRKEQLRNEKKGYTRVDTNFVLLPFLGALLRKATISFVMSVRPPARPLTRPPDAWNNSAPTGQIFMKFDIVFFFQKSVGEDSSFIKITQE